MKRKRFSEEQIITILTEGASGVPFLRHKSAFGTPAAPQRLIDGLYI